LRATFGGPSLNTRPFPFFFSGLEDAGVLLTFLAVVSPVSEDGTSPLGDFNRARLMPRHVGGHDARSPVACLFSSPRMALDAMARV